MKIAITATEPTMEASVDPRFGRCPSFVIIETDDMSFEAVDNASQVLGQGSGIQAARFMVDKGVQHVLTGNCGPLGLLMPAWSGTLGWSVGLS